MAPVICRGCRQVVERCQCVTLESVIAAMKLEAAKDWRAILGRCGHAKE